MGSISEIPFVSKRPSRRLKRDGMRPRNKSYCGMRIAE
jgi:hypothetical protein